MQLIWALLQLVCLSGMLEFTDGYATGPPFASCLSQQPRHQVSPTNTTTLPGQAATSSLVINVNSANWSNSGILTVSITGATFAGFILKAVRASNGYANPYLGPLLGNFACTTSTTTGASAPPRHISVYPLFAENNCVSHSIGAANLYQNLTCQWVGPDSNEGPIMFSATVVTNYATYYTQIFSSVIPNSAGFPTRMMPSDKLVDRPSTNGCGKTKTCILYPATCDSRPGGCRSGVMVTKLSSGDLLFELFGATFDWIAMGLGDSVKMTGQEVFMCNYNPKLNKVELQFGYAPGNLVISIHRPDITNIKTLIDLGTGDPMSLPMQPNTIYCQFVRSVNATFSVYFYNNQTNMLRTLSSSLAGEGKFVVLGQGTNVPNTPNFGQHTHMPLKSTQKYSADLSPMLFYFTGLGNMVQTHGTLMTIFWLFLCGFAVIVARHTRPVLIQKYFNKQVWFLLHVGCMVVGYLVALAGMIFILVKSTWKTETSIMAHGILGLIGMGLGLINIVAGIFRPHPDARGRSIFNRLHRYNGLLAYVCAGVAIWLGATLQCHSPQYRFWAIIVLAIWSGLQIIFMVGFEIVRLRVASNKRKELAIDKRFELTNDSSDTTKSQEQTKVKGKQLVHITDGWIVVYAVVFLGLAAAFWTGLWIH